VQEISLAGAVLVITERLSIIETGDSGTRCRHPVYPIRVSLGWLISPLQYLGVGLCESAFRTGKIPGTPL
jgi:hypothetical protein